MSTSLLRVAMKIYNSGTDDEVLHRKLAKEFKKLAGEDLAILNLCFSKLARYYIRFCRHKKRLQARKLIYTSSSSEGEVTAPKRRPLYKIFSEEEMKAGAGDDQYGESFVDFLNLHKLCGGKPLGLATAQDLQESIAERERQVNGHLEGKRIEQLALKKVEGTTKRVNEVITNEQFVEELNRREGGQGKTGTGG